MNDPRNRFLLFILGLTIGAMVSGAAVYLAFNKEKSAISISKGMIEDIANKVSVLLSRKTEAKEAPPVQAPSMSSSSVKDTSASDIISPTNETTEIESDSTLADSLKISDEDLIVVRKDELLESKTIEVIEITPDHSTKSKSDSLLEQASGIKSEKRNAGSKILFNVEFWRSPVNYRGYKLGKNKLILYGLDNTLNAALYKLNGAVYLRHDVSVYRMEIFNDFRAFEKITDPALLSVLSQS